MKIKLAGYGGAALLLSTINAQLSTLHAQGSLAPPGAPAPMMKTLAQVEPRTAISSVPFTISVPGSYYLTTNVTTAVSNAIVITANDVTLDLSGFTISSTVANAADGGTAILLAGGLSDVTILNGHIRSGVTNNGGFYSGPGFASGIFYTVVEPVSTHVSGVSVARCLDYGIYLGTANLTMVEACTVRTVGSYGIYASTIKGSVAMECGAIALDGDQVSDCQGASAGGSPGILASVVQNCYGYGYGGGTGITANTALNCFGTSGSGVGINVVTAQNCFGTSSSGIGLNAVNAQNCQGNSSGAAPGIFAETASNCYGQSPNRGISANVAISCSGRSTGGSYGLFATSVANSCYGVSATGTGLNAYIAIGCTGSSVTYTYHYNMPP